MKRYLIFAFLMVVFLACNQNRDGKVKKIKVGVFNGNGASAICVLETKEALKIDKGLEITEVSAADIANGKLDSIDVLIFPGGSGSKELNNLGIIGAQKVREFVEKGGGVVGICAGGYLLSTTPTYPSLELASFKNIDRKHYRRGRGLIELTLTKDGERIFPELKDKRVFLQYYDGPVLEPYGRSKDGFMVVGKYLTDIHANEGIPSGITPGKVIMLFQPVERGRLFIVGGHPEATPGMRWMIPRMVRCVANRPPVEYDEKWINPDQYDSALLFTPDKRKLEKKLFWQLFNDTPQVRITAMQKLYELHSRPAVRWTIGMLRDTSAEVRKKAAEILRLTEYSAAMKDLKQAYATETDPDVKQELKRTIEFLTY